METIDYKGYQIELNYDDTPENPLEWMTPEERGAWFVMSHNRYNLPMEIDVDLDEYSSWHEVAEAVCKNRPYKFVRWYEHSGIAVSLRDDTSIDDWDAGIVGIIIGETDVAINQAFLGWSQYIEGEVYYYSVHHEGELIDSLSGIFGYDSALEYAQAVIDEDLKIYKSPARNAKPASDYHK